MDAEQLDLELEESILNGTIDTLLGDLKPEPSSTTQQPPTHDGSASNGLELTAKAPDQGTASSKPAMRNPSRERLKRELGFLREYTTELEAELTNLRAQKRPLETTTLSVTGTAWKHAAEAERVKRARSERENDLLRRSLETQLRVAEELSSYLRDQATAPSITRSYESPTHIPPLLVSSSFSLVVDQLLLDIDRAYAVTDSMFPGPSWESLPDERVFVTTVKTRQLDGLDQMYIELMDTAYRSHAYERSCDAAWEATCAVYANKARTINKGPYSDDRIAARYRATGQTRLGSNKDLFVTFAAKKFVEHDRTVVVWRTCNSAASHDSDMPVQAVGDETGWMVITRVPEGVAHRPAGTAFFQACSRLIPVWFEGDVADSSVRTQLAIGEFTNVVLSATEADVTGFETAFQRLVLDDDDESIRPDHEPRIAFV